MARGERGGEGGQDRVVLLSRAGGPERGLCGEEVAVGLVQADLVDVFVADEDAVVDGLVESPADFVAGVEVELVRVLEEGEARFDVAGSGGDVEVDASELLCEAFPLEFDRAKAYLDLRVRDVRVTEQVEQVLFLCVEAGELVLELRAEKDLSFVLVCDGLDHQRAQAFEEVWVVVLGLVEVFDRCLDAPDVVEGLAAGVSLVGAEEVEVLAPVAAARALQHEALLDAALGPAFAAVDGTFEVVVVLAASFRGVAAGADDALDILEKVLVDEGLVAARELFAFVVDVAEVVAVT